MLKKIFIVDDDDMVRMMLEDHLAISGSYLITGYSTGEECLADIDKKPDVIILDFNLDSRKPDAKNGLEILKQIKAINRSTIVVMYSSQEQYGVALQTLAKGAVEYVIKDTNAFSKIDEILKRLA